MKTPVNGSTLRQHLTYSWWKYVLVAILVAVSINLYYTVSSYRSPESKKVDTYVYGLANDTGFQKYIDDVHAEKMSDMEEMTLQIIMNDSTYGPMQLMTYMAAAEGDVYILPRDNFISLAREGSFVALEEDEELMALFNDAGISLQSGWRKSTETGENHLYGIPLSKLPGMSQYVYVENGFISVLIASGNHDNCMKYLRILCEDMLKEVEADPQ